jgi:hypothetical protein
MSKVIKNVGVPASSMPILSKLKSVLVDANFKVLTTDDLDEADYSQTFNPFGSPDYWISISKFELRKMTSREERHSLTTISFKKLVTVSEFKVLDFDSDGFVFAFLERSTRPNAQSYNLRTESFNKYIDRIRSRFGASEILVITPRISVLDQTNGDAFNYNPPSLPDLKQAVIEICESLEKDHYHNYLILPNTQRLDDSIGEIEGSHRDFFRKDR